MGNSFEVIDYILLVVTLLAIVGIGLYHAIFRKQNTTNDYLFGGKKMNHLAVALSITSSMISGISLVGMPAEMYYFGIHYIFLYASMMIFTAVISYYLVMPVFYNLQFISTNTYIERRFNVWVKKFTSLTFNFQLLLYLAIVNYATALTITQIANINVHIVSTILCSLCVCYTLFGGFTAVIWTDALQYVIMLVSVLTICISGMIYAGGLEHIFDTAYNTGRLSFDLDISFTKRDTLWSAMLGVVAQHIKMYIFNQGTVQRFLSLKDYRNVKRAHILSVISWVLISPFCILTSLVAVTRYVYCDPLITGKIKKPDQLIPYMVLEMGNPFPGFSGVFIAGIISAGLSSLSTGFNSLAVTFFNDFLKSALPESIIEKHEVNMLKVITLITGILCISFVYVIENMGTIMTILLSSTSLTVAPINTIFLLGLFVPFINAKGALWAGLLSLIPMGWLIITAEWYKMNGYINYPMLPVYTNSCTGHLEVAITANESIPNSFDVPAIYKLTHHYYPLIGSFIIVVLAFFISYLTRNEIDRVEDDLLSPMVHYFRRIRRKEDKIYHAVEQTTIVNHHFGS